MTAKERYESAKALYASIGVDTDKQSVTSMPLLDQLVNQRWLCFLTMNNELLFD